MEAPEKIYVDSKAIGDNISTSVHTKPQDYPTCTEYTRTDAFIEKACEFLSNKANIPLWEGYAYTFGCDTTKLVDNFKNYMKGE